MADINALFTSKVVSLLLVREGVVEHSMKMFVSLVYGIDASKLVVIQVKEFKVYLENC